MRAVSVGFAILLADHQDVSFAANGLLVEIGLSLNHEEVVSQGGAGKCKESASLTQA